MPRATATACRRSRACRSGRRSSASRSGTIDVIGIAVVGRAGRCAGLPAARGADGRPLLVPPRERGRRGARRGARGVLPSSTTARRRRCRRRSSSRAASGDTSALEAFLSERRGSRVEVRAPERGEKRRLQELAQQNAELALAVRDVRRRDEARAPGRGARGAARGAQPRVAADPDRVLRHLEHRRARRSSARWSSSRTASRRRRTTASSRCGRSRGRTTSPRCTRSCSRRFTRLAADPGSAEWNESFAATPNLVVIDGGKGQLAAALAAMRELDLPRVAVVSLAKRIEEVFVPGRSEPILLPDALARAPAAAADPRRGASLRDHLPPAAPRRGGTRVDVRPARGRRPGAAPRAPPALRLGRAGAAARRRRSSRACRACPRRRRGASTRSCTRPAERSRWQGCRRSGQGAAWRVIRSRNFGPYFVGNAASASGTWFQNLAGSILVFRLTHSAFLLGVLAFCQFAPVLLLAPWAGVVGRPVSTGAS